MSVTNTPSAHAIATGDVPAVGASAEEKGRYVFERYAAQDAHYVGFYQTWAKTILFLLGKQWIKWLEAKRRYTTDTDVPPWRQQPVTNVTYAVYRTLAAKLTKQRPTLEVVPPSGDSDDREAARLGEAILVHLWRSLKHPAKVRRGIGWFLCTGQVFLRVHWDPEAGKRVPLTETVPHPETGQDVECPCDANGKPYTTDDGAPDLSKSPALMPEGEIAFDVETPLSVRYDPEAIDAEDAREMYVARLWPRAAAVRRFNVDEGALQTAGADGERQLYDDLLSSAASGAGWTGTEAALGAAIGASQDQALGARVLVIEYYRKQDDDRPDGAHWITVGKQKVWPEGTDEAPLPNGFWPPLIPVLDLVIPGQPQAMGVLPQVVPMNEQLNTLDGKIMEHHVMMAMGGKWILHPDDARLVINTDPGQGLTSKGYAHGHPPVQAEIKALPEAIYAERTVLMDKARLIASLSEAELGRKPEGVSAGRAFLVLQEVTDSALGPALQAWEEALEEAGRRELILVQRHYREQRTIAVRGERGQWEVRAFHGADLSDGLDVRVQVGSSFPWSKSAQLDTKLNILQSFPGLFTNPQTGEVDQEKFTQFLELSGSGLQTFAADEDADLVEVDGEHAMFAAYDPEMGHNEVPQLGFWQSHPKHLEAHLRFMKRDKGRFLRFTPAAQSAFLDHIRQTMAAVQEQADQIVAATTPAGAAPSGASNGDDASEPGATAEPPDTAMGDMGGGSGTMNANERPVLNSADMGAADEMLAGASA